MTTPRITRKKKPAATKRPARRKSVAKKPEPAVEQPAARVKDLKAGIPDHGVSFLQAAKAGWFYFIPLVGGIALAAVFAVIAPAAAIIAFLVCTAGSLAMFYISFGSQLMPVAALEMNETGDKLQLRIYYAMKGDYGAEPRFDVLGKDGYAVDKRDPKEIKPLTAFQTDDDYNSTTPESLRYMCEHSASSEAYRRQSSTLKRDIVNWMAILGLIGIFGFLTFTIGSNVLVETP